jgi:hypothetical protein
VKFQIQQELGAEPETSKGAKEGNYTLWLTEWLVRTRLLFSARSILAVSKEQGEERLAKEGLGC